MLPINSGMFIAPVPIPSPIRRDKGKVVTTFRVPGCATLKKRPSRVHTVQNSHSRLITWDIAWRAIVIFAAVGLAIVPLYFFFRPSPNPITERNRIERDYSSLIAWIENEYSKTGEYPKALPQEISRKLRKERLKGKYQPLGKRFKITFGDYMLDGYAIYWISDDGVWRIDG
jgi:hypothetical protein